MLDENGNFIPEGKAQERYKQETRDDSPEFTLGNVIALLLLLGLIFGLTASFGGDLILRFLP